jgi:hypothetical protein
MTRCIFTVNPLPFLILVVSPFVWVNTTTTFQYLPMVLAVYWINDSHLQPAVHQLSGTLACSWAKRQGSYDSKHISEGNIPLLHAQMILNIDGSNLL